MHRFLTKNVKVLLNNEKIQNNIDTLSFFVIECGYNIDYSMKYFKL